MVCTWNAIIKQDTLINNILNLVEKLNDIFYMHGEVMSLKESIVNIENTINDTKCEIFELVCTNTVDEIKTSKEMQDLRSLQLIESSYKDRVDILDKQWKTIVHNVRKYVFVREYYNDLVLNWINNQLTENKTLKAKLEKMKHKLQAKLKELKSDKAYLISKHVRTIIEESTNVKRQKTRT